jgi:AraC-like DNA-binding protein
VRLILRALTDGVSAEELLEGTGLAPAALAARDATVSLSATRRLITNANRHFPPGWHLPIVRRLDISAHGSLGFAAVTAPDVRSALAVLARHVTIRAPHIELWVETGRERHSIRFAETTELGEAREVIVEIGLLAIYAMFETLVGEHVANAAVELAYPAPPWADRLRQTLPGRVSFDADLHRISIPAAWLELPSPVHDPALHETALARCEAELRLVRSREPVATFVRRAFLASPASPPSLPALAARRNVSSRTLIRRLKREGTSYHAILDDVRRSLALEQLLGTDRPLHAIAASIGYSDAANFARAFKQWFGQPPGRYRAAQRHRE